MNQLTIKLGENKTIKSNDLVDIINYFRKEEAMLTDSKISELKHYNFKAKIEKEIETLKSLGLYNALNFKAVKYIDSKGEERPCYELNRDGMLEMLNSESVYCRAKTIEYINKLESKLKDPDSYMIENPILRAKKWIKEEEERQRLALENKQIKEERDTLETIINRLTKGCKGAMKVREAAKRLSNEGYIIGQNELYNKMRDWKMIITRINPKSGQRCGTEPFQSAINNGWLQVVMIEKNDKVFPQTLVTPKGLIYMFKKIIRETCGASI